MEPFKYVTIWKYDLRDMEPLEGDIAMYLQETSQQTVSISTVIHGDSLILTLHTENKK